MAVVHDVLGRWIRRAAQRLGFQRFVPKRGLGDGADRILRQLRINLPMPEQSDTSDNYWKAQSKAA